MIIIFRPAPIFFISSLKYLLSSMIDPYEKWSNRIFILAIVYCLLGTMQAACGFVFIFYNEEFVSAVLRNVLIELPEIEDPLSFLIWVIVGIIDVLLFIATALFLIGWEIVAPIVGIISIPSLVGGIGTLYKKKCALKTLYFTSFFYGFVFFPLGLIIMILTIRAYEKRYLMIVPQ